MNNHDMFKELLKSREAVKKLDPKFDELTMDLHELFQQSKDPFFVSMLLFKLAQEREATNKILSEINDKYDKIMLELKTGGTVKVEEEKTFTLLADQDKKIMDLVTKKNAVTATEIQKELNYKGVNAASQRLNKLFKEGYLKKAQSGKKVLYFISR
ncbi:winged helix-turn-helix domain-containing protein [Candidatus Micrarchaeota archaeon]|nr:winged helix-turn-helix domain-containing protein [Candidatus Micrarchaeota archaeon]MBU2476542.1 winged helix-turn-helix domain-containing protein [Candidatus Micrarchaeota archaeon]